jgi:hypothetical protein
MDHHRVLILSEIELNDITFPNNYDYFLNIFNLYYNDPNTIQLNPSDEDTLDDIPIKNLVYSKYDVYRTSTGFKKFIAVPFILSPSDTLVKYFYVLLTQVGFADIYIRANSKNIGCKNIRNEIMSIFALSGRLNKTKQDKNSEFVLGLSNSPRDCLIIVNNDKKLCSAMVLIQSMIKIANYFGIYVISLGDSAGVECRMAKKSGEDTCGPVFNNKNIPLSLQRRLMGKKGFYEGMGFRPKENMNYDKIFDELANMRMLDIVPDTQKYLLLFGDNDITLGQFVIKYDKTELDEKKSRQILSDKDTILRIFNKNDMVENLLKDHELDTNEILKNFEVLSDLWKAYSLCDQQFLESEECLELDNFLSDLINSERCKWIENFLNDIYQGRNEKVEKLFVSSTTSKKLSDIMKAYKKQSLSY